MPKSPHVTQAQKKNGKQTKAFWTQIKALLRTRPESQEAPPGLEFMQEPENCLDEFVTAVPLGPGLNALWKPKIACSGEPPAKQTVKSAKLALRTVRAKPGPWPE